MARRPATARSPRQLQPRMLGLNLVSSGSKTGSSHILSVNILLIVSNLRELRRHPVQSVHEREFIRTPIGSITSRQKMGRRSVVFQWIGTVGM
ncbi:unnamed protein product [Protopolystoma xenopodis]|uniref:Uncharacterized protein n=1 Tax=Protopolystoma xenopodis TaxID=117903 RepID=A0A448XKX6_9PLAT|nr:unnamed protein product [Protopolystoma xenopodis]